MNRQNIPWSKIIDYLRSGKSDKELDDWKHDNIREFKHIMAFWTGVKKNAEQIDVDEELLWKRLEFKIENARKAALRRDTFRRRAIKITTSVAAVFALMVTSYFYGRNNSKDYSMSYASMTGKSHVELPDNTTVALHNNSVLLTNSIKNQPERVVYLDGQALFDVAKDKKHPFLIKTKDLEVIVTGTKLNVLSSPDSDFVKVSLLEGSVSLRIASESLRYNLTPGKIAVYDSKTKSITIRDDDVDFSTLWSKSSIKFEDNDMSYVCKYLSKWYNVEIVLAPSLNNTGLYSFTVRDEPIEDILKIMSKFYPIEYYYTSNNTLNIKPKTCNRQVMRKE